MKLRLVAAMVLVATISLTMAPAEADVAVNCGSYDERSQTDRQVRPGVVVPTRYSWATYYDTYTIADDGTKESIYISSHPREYPLVSVWQNGTNCFGSDISRNAWAVAPDGRVFTESDFSGPPAGHYGDMANTRLNQPMVGMSPTSTGLGYWLVAADGGIFAFGDARFLGSTGAIRLNKPVTGMSVTPQGDGYWLVASDGGIFAFGNAPFYGSTGNLTLNKPISGMTTTPSGRGYWMVASDGGIFAFGDAPFKGSMGGQALSAPIAGMVPNGTGYTLIGEDGQLYPFR